MASLRYLLAKRTISHVTHVACELTHLVQLQGVPRRYTRLQPDRMIVYLSGNSFKRPKEGGDSKK